MRVVRCCGVALWSDTVLLAETSHRLIVHRPVVLWSARDRVLVHQTALSVYESITSIDGLSTHTL